MEGETSTSHEANNAATELKRWTRDLHGLPSFTYELLTKHFGTEHSGAGAQKHKKLGYQLFKLKINMLGKLRLQKCHERQHDMLDFNDQGFCTSLGGINI